MENDFIELDWAPPIPGLKFRHFRGEEDFPGMAAAIEASADADHVERTISVEDIANTYAHLTNCDPYRDMIFAEVDGRVIGYSRGFWAVEAADELHLYGFLGFLVPEWRRKGIGGAIVRWMEARLREVAAGHPPDRPQVFQAFADAGEKGFAALLEKRGYRPVRIGYEMVRPSLEDIPDFPMPEGLEVRPALPEHYRAIWEADQEAFRDHWGYTEPTEDQYREWLGNKVIFQPELWQIAWDTATDQVAGQVRTFIEHAENEKYNRKRGYTEFISVRRPWRKRGLARALIARSLAVQREQGMTESALGVDSENLSGATRIYEACGFRVVKQSTVYRKDL
jgi:GNAT superfamily N-acetyltransferase